MLQSIWVRILTGVKTLTTDWKRKAIVTHQGVNILSVAEHIIDGLITSYTLLPVEPLYIKIITLVYLYNQLCSSHNILGKKYMVERIKS